MPSPSYVVFVVRPHKPLPWMDGWVMINWNPPKRGDLFAAPGISGYSAWSGAEAPPDWPESALPLKKKTKTRPLEEILDAARFVQDLWEWSFDEGRSTPKWEFGLVLVSDGRWVLLDFPVSKMPKVTQPKKAKKQAGRGSRKKRR